MRSGPARLLLPAWGRVGLNRVEGRGRGAEKAGGAGGGTSPGPDCAQVCPRLGGNTTRQTGARPGVPGLGPICLRRAGVTLTAPGTSECSCSSHGWGQRAEGRGRGSGSRGLTGPVGTPESLGRVLRSMGPRFQICWGWLPWRRLSRATTSTISGTHGGPTPTLHPPGASTWLWRSLASSTRAQAPGQGPASR